MLQFILQQRAKILFNPGVVAQLGEVVRTSGGKRPFVATDKGIVAAGIADKVTASLRGAGIDCVVFDEILPDAPATLVDKGYDVLKREGCDAVIALGGGSTLDTAKAINVLRFNDGPIMRYTKGPESWATIKPSPGLIAVPTTAGTGSEMSNGIILIDEHHMKQTILSPDILPEYVVLDPELLLGVPPHITASTGMDALSHLLEGYFSKIANEMADIVCLGGAKAVIDWLPKVFNDPKDITARSYMMASATLGGWMLVNVATNTGHSISHVIGSLFGIPHGFGCAYALPPVTAFNAVVIPEKTKTVGKLFGVDFTDKETPEEIGIKVRDAMVHFRDTVLKMKPARDFNIDRSRLPEAAELVTKEAFQRFNVREVSVRQAQDMLEYIFK